MEVTSTSGKTKVTTKVNQEHRRQSVKGRLWIFGLLRETAIRYKGKNKPRSRNLSENQKKCWERDGLSCQWAGLLQELSESEEKKLMLSVRAKSRRKMVRTAKSCLQGQQKKSSRYFGWYKSELLMNEERWLHTPDNANKAININRADCQHTSNSWLRAAIELSSLKSIRDVAKVRKKLPSEIEIPFLCWV